MEIEAEIDRQTESKRPEIMMAFFFVGRTMSPYSPLTPQKSDS